MGSPSNVNRRDLIKRSAALGVLAVPAVGALSSCASSGGGGQDKVDKGEKSADNPLGVNKDAGIEVVIFDGGYGDQYAKDAEKVFTREGFGEVKHSKTQKIRTKMQPRMVKGNPPDVINNSGAENMDIASLIDDEQVTDLKALLDSPAPDDPNQTVRDVILPSTITKGQFGTDAMYQLNYSFTVYGLWYSKKALRDLDVEYPKTWDEMLAVCAKAKKQGIAGWTYAGKHPYYFS